MRIARILGLFLLIFNFAACKDAKVNVKLKSKTSSSNPPGFEINGQTETLIHVGAGITLKARAEMNPVVTAPTSTLTGSGITMRAGVVR